MLRRVGPLPNARGVLVVEVDKACRDLKMLTRTVRMSKFYKVIVGSDITAEDDNEIFEDNDNEEE